MASPSFMLFIVFPLLHSCFTMGEIQLPISQLKKEFLLECKFGNLQNVKLLLNQGIDPNGRDSSGRTCLALASLGSHEEIVSYLVKIPDVDASLPDERGFSPLDHALESQNFKIASLLMSHRKYDLNGLRKSKNTILGEACLHGNRELVKILLADRRIDVNKAGPSEKSPFYLAAESGQVDIIRILLNDPRVDPNIKKNDTSPVVAAYKNDEKHVLNLLLSNPRVDLNGNSPSLLELAIINNDHDLVQRLLDNPRVNTSLSMISLSILLGISNQKITETVLTHPRFNVNGGEFPFLWAASFFGLESWVTRLLDFPKVLVNQKSAMGEAALHAASENGHEKIVNLLLKANGIDVNLENEDGVTPLELACQREKLEVVKLLLEDPRVEINRIGKTGKTVLGQVCETGNHSIIHLLVSHPRVNVNKPDLKGCSPLCQVIQSGNVKLVKTLLDIPEIDVNQKDKDGWIPLRYACSQDTPVLNLLLNDPRLTLDEKTKRYLTKFCPHGKDRIKSAPTVKNREEL